ncbi:MAG: glycerol acyltransferase [Bacteroidales bacterium]|nr:glycerol acyltransferase [Bacteroidales bacterium]
MKTPLQIDLRSIIRKRLPEGKGERIPGFIFTVLERLICQKELNEMLRFGFPKEGYQFARAILQHLDITIKVEGLENITPGRHVFVSNHPLGGLDGIALIALLGERYGDDGIRFLVNDMLMNVDPLKKVFLPVNKFGAQGRDVARAIDESYASGRQVMIFPAGLVSRLGEKGVIADLDWQKTFVTKSVEHGRDIIPIRFVAHNRPRFYRIAKWRKKLNVKVNLEQILLPSEVCHTRNVTFRIIIGKPISPEKLLAEGLSPKESARKIRSEVYRLLPPEKI